MPRTLSQKVKSSNYQAIFLAAGAVALASPAWADLTVMRSGVAITQGNGAAGVDVWPNALGYVNDPPIITANPGNLPGDGAPNNGTDTNVNAETVSAGPVPDFPGAPYYVLSQTFTPASNFTMGAISFVLSAGNNGDTTDPGLQLKVNLFQLRTGITGATTGYQLFDPVNNIANQVGPEMLGNGNGLNYTVPVPGLASQVTEFDFSNNAAGGGTNDQIALQAGVTYAFEIWGLAGETAASAFIERTQTNSISPQPYSGGQVLSNHATNNPDDEESLSPELRGQVVGGGVALDLDFAIYGVPGTNQVLPTWTATGGGSWTNSANWLSGVIPNSATTSANFLGAITAPSIVTLDAGETVGSIVFNSSNSYTLAPGTGGKLILDNGGATATATVTSTTGNHTISAPITLNSTGSFIVSNAANLLTVSGNISGNNTLVTGGPGTVFLTGTNTYNGGGVQITAGTLKIGSNAALQATSPANISTGATLDLNGFSPTISTLFGDGIIDNVAGGGTSVFTNGSTGSSTFSGVIRNTSGSVALNFVGSGSLLLTARSAANTYSGGTSIASGGTVVIGATQAFPVGGTVANNGTFSVAAGSQATPVVVGKITGSGTLAVGNTSLGSAGFVQLAASSGADTQGAIAISTGSTLDITNNKLVINYGSSADPTASIAAALTTGYNGGNWAGASGILSSAAAANASKFAVGYIDGNNPADTIAKTVSANQAKVAFTLAGDAFLEGTVGFDDLVVVAQNFGFTGKDWAGGNFNYDPSGSVGFPDLVNVAQNFGFASGVSEGSGGGSLAAAWQAANVQSTAVTPEPASLTLIGLGAASLLARRRRGANA